MTTELALNILLGMAAINSIVTARTNATDRRARVAQYGPGLIAWLLFAGVAFVSMWIWIAFLTGHWQFAALTAIPTLITIGSVTSKTASTEAAR